MLEHSVKLETTVWAEDIAADKGKDLVYAVPTNPPALATTMEATNHQNLPPATATNAADPIAATLSTLPIAALRTGRWSSDEKLLFLHGLKRFGKGRWKKMSVYLPHRSLVQIKSHAQKVLKRQEGGEDIFRKLEDTDPRLIDSLVVQASREREALRAAGVNVNTTKPAKSLIAAAQKSENKTTPKRKKSDGESVIAAAALCQLSSVGPEGQQQQQQQQWGGLDPLNVMPMVDQTESV